MNNDRGQSLHIPSITSLKENNIYVATLHFVIQTDVSSEVKHQFTYKIKVNNQIVYTNHNISTQASTNQVSFNDWLKRYSNYSVGYKTYESYIDGKHLIHIDQYNDNYYVHDVAPLKETEGIL